MKHNYKISVDDTPPTDEQISRHKNFDRILADYHNLTQPIYRRPLYKNPRAFVGLVLILVIGFLVFQAVEEEEKEIAQQELPAEIRDAEERAFLKPPIAELAVNYQEFELGLSDTAYPRIDGKLALDFPEVGTLLIPEDQFRNANGSPVDPRQINLMVRILDDPLEMLAAGVPMHTRDGEDQQQLEAVSMLEIRAEVDGKPVELAGGAEIVLRLPNRVQAPPADLQLYRLDTATRNWISLQPGYQVVRAPLNGSSLKGHHSTEDGFDMVEFDAEGNPIDRRGENAIDTAFGFQPQLTFSSLGFLSLDRKLTHQRRKTAQIRLLDETGDAIRAFALYKLIYGVNTIAYYWPQDKDLTYELSYLPGIPQTLFGFTEDGKLFHTEPGAVDKLQEDEEVQGLTVRVRSEKVNNIQDLRQLLALDPGQ